MSKLDQYLLLVAIFLLLYNNFAICYFSNHNKIGWSALLDFYVMFLIAACGFTIISKLKQTFLKIRKT